MNRRAWRTALLACGTLLAMSAACGATGARRPAAAPDSTRLHVFVRGADVSSLPAVEAAGARFRDAGVQADPLTILRANGLNGARLRLWHTPVDGSCGLGATVAMAKRLRAAGLPLLLDIHYSDTWADPGHQSKPFRWERADFAALRDSVRAYTRDVIAAFREAGVMPDAVQLGNEIGNGLLWPDGRLNHGANAAAEVGLAATLLREAAEGARLGAAGRPLKLMLHYEGGGDPRGAREWLEALVGEGVPFDCIGLSYYPWWHGPLDSLATNITGLRQRFHRDVFVVECGYPSTLHGWDDVHNVVGSRSQLVPGYAATPEGQGAFVREVVQRARAAGAAGVYYWEPAWVSAPRSGSAWENVALFDSSGVALPALRALGR